jgi:hypothetical protein
VYNVLWGVAWRVFMRREWEAAATAIRQAPPWLPHAWVVWGVGTIPIGVAIVAYAAPRSAALRAAGAGAAAVWVVVALGMTINGSRQGFTTRVLLLDALVNLIAMEMASLAAVWRVAAPRSRQPIPIAMGE